MHCRLHCTVQAMLKLRRDLSRAVTLLEMVKRREKTKKEKLNLTLDVFEKRHSMRDWDGKLLEAANMSRPKSAQVATPLCTLYCTLCPVLQHPLLDLHGGLAPA